jgi:hypothetical protein
MQKMRKVQKIKDINCLIALPINKKATPMLEWLFSPFFCKKYLDTR